MYFLVLLSALLACAVGKCYNSNLILDGPDIQDRYMYRVALSRLTQFKFEYFAGAIAYRGWREGER